MGKFSFHGLGMKGVAAAVVLIMVGILVPLNAAPARADSAPVVTVAYNGPPQISSYTEDLGFQAQVQIPAGVTVASGSTMAVTLPDSLMVHDYDANAQSSMISPPVYDTQTRTFTFRWGELSSGQLYSFPMTLRPSPTMTTSSDFVVSSSLIGATVASEPFSITADSTALSAVGTFQNNLATADQWQAPYIVATMHEGGSAYNAATITKRGNPLPDASFNDLRIQVDYSSSSSWLQPARATVGGPKSYFPVSTKIEDSVNAWETSFGPQNYQGVDSFQVLWYVDGTGLEPGIYTVPYRLFDVRPDGTRVSVAGGTLQATILAPQLTTISYINQPSTSQVVPGGEYRNFVGGAYDASSKLTSLQYFIKIPQHSTPVTIASGNNGSAEVLTGVDYSFDGLTWVPLARNGAVWEFSEVPNNVDIQYLRLTERDSASESVSSANSITYSVNTDATAGDMLELGIEKATFVDPVAGDTTQGPSDLKEIEVVSAYTAKPQLGGSTTRPYGNDFGASYTNGQVITQSLRVFGASSTPAESPFIFAIVPAGMDMTSVTDKDPTGGNDWNGLLVRSANPFATWTTNTASLLGLPTRADIVTSETLSDGSTIYFWNASDVGLTGVSGSVATYEEMISNMQFSLKTMKQGDYTVQVGVGSATTDDYDVAPNVDFLPTAYSDPSQALGSYSELDDEVAAFLKDQGVVSDSLLSKALPFSVAGFDQINVTTEILGSEDSAPILNNGTAVTKPGASTEYTVIVNNGGTYAYENFEFIDVLPYANDTYTLTSSARLSEFNLNVSGKFTVLLNGKPVDAEIEVSRSEDPPRFDAAGQAVAGSGTWEAAAGGTDGMRSVRILMPAGALFNPGDELKLSFDAVVPLNASRDGATANNSVAYYLERPDTASGGIYQRGLEVPAGSVRTPALSGVTGIAGQIYDDYGDGVNGGLELHLYRMDGSDAIATGDVSIPSSDGVQRGVYGFTGLEPNQTYLVKPVPISSNYVLNTDLLDGDGFLKYDYQNSISDQANAPEITRAYNGLSKFRLGDDTDSPSEWIKDLDMTVTVLSGVSGSLSFVDKDGVPVAGADQYLSDWNVAFSRSNNQPVRALAEAETKTSSDGTFEIADLNVPLGEYLMTFLSPRPPVSSLVFAADNQVPGFDASNGTYTQNPFVPGNGIDNLTVRVTDNEIPIVSSVTVDKYWNPSGVSVTATDEKTEVVRYLWTLNGPNGYSVSSMSSNPLISIPADLVEGQYSLMVSAVDLANNESEVASVDFGVDLTAPVLSSNTVSITATETNPVPIPTTGAEWISLYGVTATDSISGMPTTGDLGITVDASDVVAAPGSYTVVFTATDLAGNVSLPLSVDFIIEFVGYPTITVQDSEARFEIHQANGTWSQLTDTQMIALFGVTADPVGEAVPIKNIEVDQSSVNYAEIGNYIVRFRAVDEAGQMSDWVSATLYVVDTAAPELVAGKDPIRWVLGGSTDVFDRSYWIGLFEVTATDNGSGVSSDGIQVDASDVDFNSPGSYSVRFSVTDNAGNTSELTVVFIVALAEPGGNDTDNNSGVAGTGGENNALINGSTGELSKTGDAGNYALMISLLGLLGALFGTVLLATRKMSS